MANTTTGIPVFYFRPDIWTGGTRRDAVESDPAYELGEGIEEMADAKASSQ